jgi:hypothetical protein
MYEHHAPMKIMRKKGRRIKRVRGRKRGREKGSWIDKQ